MKSPDHKQVPAVRQKKASLSPPNTAPGNWQEPRGREGGYKIEDCKMRINRVNRIENPKLLKFNTAKILLSFVLPPLHSWLGSCICPVFITSSFANIVATD